MLINYLNYSVVKPAQYLKESSNILRAILSDKEFAQVGFGLDLEKVNKANTQLIAPQVVLIDEYLNQLPFSENQMLGSQLLQVKDSLKFKKLFKNTPLPITLN